MFSLTERPKLRAVQLEEQIYLRGDARLYRHFQILRRTLYQQRSSNVKGCNIALAENVCNNASCRQAIFNPQQQAPAHGPCKPEQESPPWLHLSLCCFSLSPMSIKMHSTILARVQTQMFLNHRLPK